MSLEKLLSEKKSTIISRWFEAVLESYPSDTSNFLREQKNQFSNPVGSTILAGIDSVFNELLSEGSLEKMTPFLDNIIRIRAIQDFTPSQAVAFMFSLKKVIRDELAGEEYNFAELQSFENRVDSLALLSFDIFMKCREKLYDIKANELRNMTFRLVQRANKSGEVQDDAELNTDNENKRGK